MSKSLDNFFDLSYSELETLDLLEVIDYVWSQDQNEISDEDTTYPNFHYDKLLSEALWLKYAGE